MQNLLRTGIMLACALSPVSAAGIIFFATADANYNTSAPRGSLTNSGWESQGSWGDFLGTAIAPQFFVTAKHVGGSVGSLFSFQGVDYTTIAVFNATNSDLSLWQINGRFPLYAQPYSRSDEAGKDLVVFGRGTQRGAEVSLNGPTGPVLKGWQWGPADGRKRWGQNQISAIVTGGIGHSGSGTGSETSDLLKMLFNAGAGPNEATLSVGDSGGGVFVQDGVIWKLAGINRAVDGPYNTTSTGPGFQAAVFDEGGLFVGGEGNWSLVRDTFSDVPGAIYATRISSNLTWINSILSQPGSNEPPILQSASALQGVFSDVTDASVNAATQVITVGQPAGGNFYRIRSSSALLIVSIRIVDGNLVLNYQ